MEAYLYQDLYDLENTHWWHIAKRRTAFSLLQSVFPPGGKILDLGCGTGQNAVEFSRLGTTYGVDMEAEAIRFCKKRGLKHVRQGTADNLPFPDGSFDAVTLLDVLEHTEEDPTLTEVFRVLKPGGSVLISVPAFQWLWSSWDEVLHHKKRYTRTDVTAALKRHGFIPITVGYAYSYLLPPVWLVRKLKSRRRREEYGSDFRLGNPIVNTILGWLADWERPLVQRGLVPFGTSVIALARKP